MINIATLWDPQSDTQGHFFFFTFPLHRTDISSLPLLFSLFFLSFLLQAGFFQLLLFFFSFFFFSSSRLGSFIFFSFFFFSFFFILVSFLLFLHEMMAEMAEGFDFSCDLNFNRAKVCFWRFDFKAFFFLIFFFIFLSFSDPLQRFFFFPSSYFFFLISFFLLQTHSTIFIHA